MATGKARRSLTRRFYDRYWQSEAGLADHHNLRLLREEAHRYAHGWVGDLSGCRVLDVGCGSGDDTLALTRRGGRVVGIDISASSLITVRHRLARAGLARGGDVQRSSAESLPFANETFDLVFMNSVLMHVEAASALAECRRVTKRGGSVIIVEPLLYCPAMWLYRKLFSSFEKVEPRYLSLRQLLRMGVGFSRIEHREFFFLAVVNLLFHRLTGVEKVLPFLGSVDAWLGQRLPLLAELYWIAVVKMVK